MVNVSVLQNLDMTRKWAALIIKSVQWRHPSSWVSTLKSCFRITFSTGLLALPHGACVPEGLAEACTGDVRSSGTGTKNNEMMMKHRRCCLLPDIAALPCVIELDGLARPCSQVILRVSLVIHQPVHHHQHRPGSAIILPCPPVPCGS